ncbi:hypothetical protein RJZ57_003194 [Blastomyces gilchristii]
MVELLSQDFEDDWRYAEIKNPVAATCGTRCYNHAHACKIYTYTKKCCRWLGSHFYGGASREDIEFFKALFSLDASRHDIVDAFNVLEGYWQSVLDLPTSLPTAGGAPKATRADITMP